MAITLTQTDTVAACAAQWSGNTQQSSQKATAGGTAGVTPINITHDASASSLREIFFQSATAEPNNATWATGNWTFRLEVTTANMNLTWDLVGVGNINNSCAAAWITTAIVNQALSSTGVKSSTNNLVSYSGTPTAQDMFYVIFQVVSSSTMSTQAWAYKPSQNIDTPVSQVASFTPLPGKAVMQAVKRASYF